jgi:hypothetical protein
LDAGSRCGAERPPIDALRAKAEASLLASAAPRQLQAIAGRRWVSTEGVDDMASNWASEAMRCAGWALRLESRHKSVCVAKVAGAQPLRPPLIVGSPDASPGRDRDRTRACNSGTDQPFHRDPRDLTRVPLICLVEEACQGNPALWTKKTPPRCRAAAGVLSGSTYKTRICITPGPRSTGDRDRVPGM